MKPRNAGFRQSVATTKRDNQLHSDTMMEWVVPSGALVAMLLAMLGIRKEVLSSVDRRIDERADARIAAVIDAKVDPLIAEVRTVGERLNNGLTAEVKSHTLILAKLSEQQAKTNAGLAEIKGRFDTFLDVTLDRRVQGRRSSDPD